MFRFFKRTNGLNIEDADKDQIIKKLMDENKLLRFENESYKDNVEKTKEIGRRFEEELIKVQGLRDKYEEKLRKLDELTAEYQKELNRVVANAKKDVDKIKNVRK